MARYWPRDHGQPWGFFGEEHNKSVIYELFNLGVKPTDPTSTRAPGARLASIMFVLTGNLASMTREEATARIESLGGKVMKSVSKNTNYLVVGEKPGSNRVEALKLGIATLNEKEFKELLGDG